MKQITNNMKEVICWLFSYPEIMISSSGGLKSNWVSWTASWINEDARKHMVKISGDLFGVTGSLPKTEKRWNRQITEGTPRITLRTFKGLLRRGLIRPHKRRIPMEGLSEMYYFQLTEEGKTAVTGLKIVQSDSNPIKAESGK